MHLPYTQQYDEMHSKAATVNPFPLVPAIVIILQSGFSTFSLQQPLQSFLIQDEFQLGNGFQVC